jgi:hypothetical protein
MPEPRRNAAHRAFGLRDDGDLVVFCLEGTMMEHERSAPHFDAVTARLLRREALRRAANELNTTSGPGLESVLARISAEVTAEAAGRTPPCLTVIGRNSPHAPRQP